MCIIRQLINQHSIIDSYPMMAVLGNNKASGQAPRKPQRQHDDTADTDPPTDDSYSSCDDDDSSVLSEMEPLPRMVRPPPTNVPVPAPSSPPPAPVMSDKIAQDVLVFKKIAQMMPPQSLLHLLKADVLVQVDTPNAPDASTLAHHPQVIDTQVQVEKEARQEDTLRSSKHVLAPLRATKVRFASNGQGKLLSQTKFFEPVRDKSLWWQRDEMETIRAECCGLVEDYNLYKKQFECDLTSLMDSANEANLQVYNEHELEFLDNHQVARGLERHIVIEFETVKQFHFRAIMRAQHDYKERGTSERWKHIKKVSLANSLPTRYIAVRLAQNDQVIVQREMATEESSFSPKRSSSSQALSPRRRQMVAAVEALSSSLASSSSSSSPSRSTRRRPMLSKSSLTPSGRNLRNFLKRTVSRRFSTTG